MAYGDKTIGTHHILSTGRSVRYTGDLWVSKILKTATYQRMTPTASRLIGKETDRQCRGERMLPHAITAQVRVGRYRDRCLNGAREFNGLSQVAE